MKIPSSVRGMADIFPFAKGKDTSELTSHDYAGLEQILASVSFAKGFERIRTPLVEHTELFARSVGEETDIVGKEMFLLDNPEYCLRPEGTSGVLRAVLSSGKIRQKLWYWGEMFRKERPQKGRYRQFTQFGLECFGYPDVVAETQMLMMCRNIWEQMGVADRVSLEINSLGTSEERRLYKTRLREYFQDFQDLLSDDEKSRLEKNPLRILDSKNPNIAECVAGAPKLSDFLSDESSRYFERWCGLLDAAGISYTVNPNLVRGLDYYNHSVFEWVTDGLGAQAAVCGGGRYDGLMGIPYAVGMAIGVERLLLLAKAQGWHAPMPDKMFYLVSQGDAGLKHAICQNTVLDKMGLDAELDYGGKLSDQLKRASASGAKFAVICGDDEARSHTVRIKVLRTRAELVLPARDWQQIINILQTENQG